MFTFVIFADWATAGAGANTMASSTIAVAIKLKQFFTVGFLSRFLWISGSSWPVAYSRQLFVSTRCNRARAIGTPALCPQALKIR
jgi:hypothetical protein